MFRWNRKEHKDVEVPRIDNFLEEILSVCKKHNLSISHEDWHGAFIIEEYSDKLSQWLNEATTQVKE